MHSTVNLSPFGGVVGLFDGTGRIVDFLAYPSLPDDHSYGRFPDGGADLRLFTLATPRAVNDAPPSPLILNEYNAVTPTKLLKNLGTDSFWGRIPGNGGDWFELVVTGDHLDVRSQPPARQRRAHGGQQPRRDHVRTRLAIVLRQRGEHEGHLRLHLRVRAVHLEGVDGHGQQQRARLLREVPPRVGRGRRCLEPAAQHRGARVLQRRVLRVEHG